MSETWAMVVVTAEMTGFKRHSRDFPGSPLAKILHSQCRDLGLHPGREAGFHRLQLKIPQASTKTQHSQIHFFFFFLFSFFLEKETDIPELESTDLND